MTKFYERKDWPSLPKQMVRDLVITGRSAERAVPADKKPPFSMLKAPWSLREWVSKNIPIEIDERWMVTLQRFDCLHAPFHTDTMRDWSYNYVIDGKDAVTYFKDDIDGDVVDSVQYEKNVWYYHNGSVPHAVKGINGQRLAVTMFLVNPDTVGTYIGTTPQLLAAYERDPYFYYIEK